MRQVDLGDAIQFILANLNDTRKVVRHTYRIRKRLVGLAMAEKISERDFYRITKCAYSAIPKLAMAELLHRGNGGRRVKAADNQGDFKKNGTFYEYKGAGFNEDNVVNIVQIRLWRNCDYTIQSISDNGAVTFMLDHEEMRHKTVIVPATAAHGTRLVTGGSQHVELRMTFGRDSEVWDRWVDQYANRMLK
ncbi:MAG: hypothetical protein OXD43_00905 [Bacteroidetes bacterium]|nr:hypothetical protein [Bacteroidota bacterium]